MGCWKIIESIFVDVVSVLRIYSHSLLFVALESKAEVSASVFSFQILEKFKY